MSSYENDITTAVAELLAARGAGEWRPNGVYNAGARPAIFVQVVPDIPRDVITLSPYPVQAGIDPNDSVLGMQVRTRTQGRDPRRTNDLDGAVYDVLHGARGLSLSGYRITKILFQSGASMGQDGSERWGRSANYYITGPRHQKETP